MASLDTHTSSSSVRTLCIGDNGSGKTGALVSLAEAGYNLRILDFDRGTEVLAQLCSPSARKRVDVETFVNDYEMVLAGSSGKRMVPKKPVTAFINAMNCLASWPGLGSPTSWGPETVLVVDTLTRLGNVCMEHTMDLKGKFRSLDSKDWHPSQPDWGDAMKLQENVLAMLQSDDLKCHVIVNAHVVFLTPDGELSDKGFPSALGNKLPPKIGGYFNSTLHFSHQGVGANKRRGFYTKSTGLISTKTPAPGKVKDFYPIESGLAEYFKDLGHSPSKGG
jgi:hypothetical protein